MKENPKATLSKEVADAIEAWFEAKAFSVTSLEYSRAVTAWDGHDAYVVEEEIRFLPVDPLALSAEIWITQNSAIGLGFRISSETTRTFLWGFEPIFIDIASILGLVDLAANGSFGVSWLPLLQRWGIRKRLCAPQRVCELIATLTEGYRLQKIYSEETQFKIRRTMRLEGWY